MRFLFNSFHPLKLIALPLLLLLGAAVALVVFSHSAPLAQVAAPAPQPATPPTSPPAPTTLPTTTLPRWAGLYAPTALAGTVLTASQVQLTWSDNATTESMFRIEISTDGINFQPKTTARANATTCNVPRLNSATQYYFRVYAVNGGGDSDPSNMITLTTAPLLIPGAGFTGPTTPDPAVQTGMGAAAATPAVHSPLVATSPSAVMSHPDGEYDSTIVPNTLPAALTAPPAPGIASTPAPAITGTLAAPSTSTPSVTTVTTQPTTQPGSDALAIARWDVVPYQTFDGEFNVGIVAFHINGIQEVDLSVNGGPWVKVTHMTLNPQTANHSNIGNPSDGVVEYWATLDAAKFPADGPLEVRAVVYPTVGVPRVLQGATVSPNGNQSITLYVNAHGTLPQQTLWVATTGSDTTGDGSQQKPFASLLKAGQTATSGTTIYLTAGTYQFATPISAFNTNDRWIVITVAPGLTKSDVIIQPRGQPLRVNHLAIFNVSIDAVTGQDLAGWPQVWNDNELWLDNIDISSSLGKSHLPELNASINSAWAAAYLTNSAIHDYPGRAVSSPKVVIVRNSQISNIGDDAFDNPQLVVNTKVSTVIANDPADHIDAFQWFGSGDLNSIVFNSSATNIDGQLLFMEADGSTSHGIAVVNFLGVSSSVAGAASQFGKAGTAPVDNLLLLNITLPNQYLYINSGDVAVTNARVECVAAWRFYGGIDFTNSHLIDASGQTAQLPQGGSLPAGTYTMGDPGFITAAGANYVSTEDFHPNPNSVLRNRLPMPLLPVDLEGFLRSSPDTIGAFR